MHQIRFWLRLCP